MTKRKSALVTGASSGIGRAITQTLLENNFTVYGLSRDAKNVDINHEQYTGIELDLGMLEKSDKLVRELLVKQNFDCFIHAAGSGSFGSIEQFSVSQIDSAIRLNLTSALILCRSLVPVFRRNKRGHMIFIGSESSLTAGKKGVLYSAAKFGLRGLCQALRQDCAADGINISLINPGMVRSPFFDKQEFRPGANPENAIEVEDVARVVWQILQSNSNIVFDEINLSPRVKSIDFSSQKKPGVG
jgi:3-hydroxy acid dehydrogenase/malonic semialdehyde reductase